MEVGEKGIVGISTNVTYWLPVFFFAKDFPFETAQSLIIIIISLKELGATKAQMW